MAIPAELLARLDDEVTQCFEAEQVPALRRLVDLPSHTFAKDDVEHAASALDVLAVDAGLAVERVPDESGRFADHRLYRTPAALGAPTRALALVGHIDTVFPRTMGFLEMTRDVDDGRPGDVVHGPGTLDMKSGLVSVLFALRAVRRAAPEVFARLPAVFVCVSDEETGSPSSRAIYERLAPELACALVFEAGRERDEIVVARRGAAVFTITAHGQSAHAGNKLADGVNAIHALALLVPRVEALTDEARGVTCNVGLIEGGTAKNTVPDRAKITIDMRFTTTEGADATIAALRALVADPFTDGVTPPRLARARFVLDGGVSRPPMEPLPSTNALVALYDVHARACGLGGGAAPLQGGGSDANLLAAHGVPVIDGLGPYGKHFHQVEEWSSLGSLLRRTRALARFLVDESWVAIGAAR